MMKKELPSSQVTSKWLARWRVRDTAHHASRSAALSGENFGLQERAISVKDSKPENELSPANEPCAADETDP